MRRRNTVLAAALAFGIGAPLSAQTTQPAQPPQESPKPLEVGVVAPDFELPGATRYGILQQPIHLSDFKGKTVVLAFFFKARTKG
jgi:cytochrome oxidase Cu insertion factor (SCO1/SenC/PrrC family)